MLKHFTFLILGLTFVFLTACQKPTTDSFESIIEAYGVSPDKATLFIKRLSDDKVWMYNSKRAELRYIPASTSKIPHTL